MTETTTSLPRRATRLQLWIEFTALFIGVPIIMAATLGLYPLFPVIISLAILSGVLLQFTPGWQWSMLWRGPVLGEWRLIALYFLATLATCLAVVFTLIPYRFLEFPLNRPELWIMVVLLYPIFSALPQELIFRSLFFERYGDLFPGKWAAIAANGFVFGFGHLFFDNWVTIAMTGIGGAIMGWAYLRHRSVGLAWVLHSLAGQLIFTIGLGVYFYHGAIGHTP
ncbi:MAG: type II CAAX endopeptidase family protein [Pseudomonadota bacterium]